MQSLDLHWIPDSLTPCRQELRSAHILGDIQIAFNTQSA